MNKQGNSDDNVLSIGALREGFVLDHIRAGKAMRIYRDLKLDKLDCTVAIIKNASSHLMGRKDIIKVACPIDYLDLDVLGFIDHNITVNVIACKNPRCITSIEQGLDQVFLLTDEATETYRCRYCETKYSGKKNK